MPKMDGLTFIEEMVKSETLLPIIVVSSFSQKGAKIVLDALENGAVDFVTIQSNIQDNENLKETLVTKIKIAYNSDPYQLIPEKIHSLRPKHQGIQIINSSERLVVIGSSTGGPGTIQKILQRNLHHDYLKTLDLQ